MTKIKANINLRIIGLYLVTLLISAGIVSKIIRIQHFNTVINTSSQPRYFTVPAPRGNIIADDGSLLAISMPLYNVRLDMSVMKKIYVKIMIIPVKIEKLAHPNHRSNRLG